MTMSGGDWFKAPKPRVPNWTELLFGAKRPGVVTRLPGGEGPAQPTPAEPVPQYEQTQSVIEAAAVLRALMGEESYKALSAQAQDAELQNQANYYLSLPSDRQERKTAEKALRTYRGQYTKGVSPEAYKATWGVDITKPPAKQAGAGARSLVPGAQVGQNPTAEFYLQQLRDIETQMAGLDPLENEAEWSTLNEQRQALWSLWIKASAPSGAAEGMSAYQAGSLANEQARLQQERAKEQQRIREAMSDTMLRIGDLQRAATESGTRFIGENARWASPAGSTYAPGREPGGTYAQAVQQAGAAFTPRERPTIEVDPFAARKQVDTQVAQVLEQLKTWGLGG